MTLEVRPVAADRWQELSDLFGRAGAFSHCWCTWWRQTSNEFSTGVRDGGAGNKALMHAVVESGSEPGMLAYRDGKPVGWISVAPRPQFGRILRSRRIGPPSDEATDGSVWSIVCFWIPRTERGKGVATALLDGAVEHARARGAATLEAYPVDAADGRLPSSNVFTGTVAMFARAAFIKVGTPRGSQVVMRRSL